MRGMGFYFGIAKRNDPVILDNPRPVTRYDGNDIDSGDAARDGFTVLSRANAQAQGSPPPVDGVIGPAFQGPDQSFES